MSRLTVDGMLVGGIILLLTLGCLIASVASLFNAQWLTVILGAILFVGTLIYAAFAGDVS